jgi:hypothetical protein
MIVRLSSMVCCFNPSSFTNDMFEAPFDLERFTATPLDRYDLM